MGVVKEKEDYSQVPKFTPKLVTGFLYSSFYVYIRSVLFDLK